MAPYTTANGVLSSDSPYGMQSDPYNQPMYGRPMYGSAPYNSSYPGTTYNGPYGGGYGAGGMYGSSYGGGMYNNSSSMYNSTGMYGNASRGGMGGYGAGGYGVGGYSGGAYGSGGYGGYGGYGYNGVAGVPPGMPPPGHPPGGPGQPGNLLEGAKSKWQVFMQSLHNLMNFFGRISFLMDENAHAVHFFITALLQLLDRASFLWGEVARFVLRVLGYKFSLGRAASQGGLAKPADGKVADAAPAPQGAAALESAWSGE